MIWHYILTAIYILLGLAAVIFVIIMLTIIVSTVQMRTWISVLDRFLSNKYHKLKKEENVQKN
jgi:hypothetical protein